MTTATTSSFGDGTALYALGAVTGVATTSTKNGTAQPTTSTTQSYAWYDGAVLSQVAYSVTGQSTKYTNYTNAASGVLRSADVGDGRARTITVTSDALGQAVRRDEADGNAWNGTTLQGGDPHEAWYRFDGRQIGYTGNDGTWDSSYAGSLDDRTHTVWGGTGAFRYGGTLGAATADFNDRLTPVNTWSQGSSGGSYTVRAGDTLAGIAAQLWGDAGLWYKLAEANGLTGDGSLVAGQTLTVPSGVMKNADNAGTFKPYDVSQAYGDTSPTTPTPQAAAKKNKCGVFGQILLVAIAVAVTIWASPAAPTFWQGVIAGAAGSLASQTVGLATGIQQKFDFKGLALSAISGGVTAGVNGSSVLNGIKSGVVKAAVAGVISSTITQGIGVATGLQNKFDFASVAAAGIGAGIGNALGGTFAKLGKFGGTFAANAVGGVVTAAARSLITGTDFGDNVMAVLPSVIGNTIGSLAGRAINDPFASTKIKGAGAPGQPAASSGADQAPVAGLSAAQNGDIVITATRTALHSAITDYNPFLQANFSDSPLDCAPKKGKLRTYQVVPESQPVLGRTYDAPDPVEWYPQEFFHPGVLPDGRMAMFPPDSTAATTLANQRELARITGGNASQPSLAASSIAPGTSAVSVVIKGLDTAAGWLQSLGDGATSVLSTVSDWTYQKLENGLNYLEDRGVFTAPLVGQALQSADVALNAAHTVAQGLNALPSLVAHPLNTFKSIGYSGASMIDWMARADSKPAGQFISDNWAAFSKLTPRQLRQGIGVAAGIIGGFFLPTKGLSADAVAADSLVVAEEGISASRVGASGGAKAAAINPRLIERLGKWRSYQENGGQLDMHGWVKATQGQRWGVGGRSGYADWIRRAESTNGNSLLSRRPASLYEMYDRNTGEFLKHGITQDLSGRYSTAYLADKQVIITQLGQRSQIAKAERFLEESQPGRLNRQPWAVRAWDQGLGRVK